MIKRIRTLILTALTGGMLLFPVLAPITVGAQATTNGTNIQGSVCSGAKNLSVVGAGSSGDCTDPDGENTVDKIIKTVINLFSIIVAVIAVIMIIVGGVKYITSGGESGKVTSAKNTILFAIIGLIVVAFAQIIVRFVLSKTVGTG